MKRSWNKISWDKTLFISIVVGVLVIFMVFVGCTENEKLQGQSLIEETLDFMKSQCARYDNQIATAETKSQVALLDKMHELARYLSNKGSSDIENTVLEFANNQRLSGVIVLDEEGECLAGVFRDNKTYDDYEYLLDDDNVLQVMEYPQKNYLSHIENDDGSVYDYVAISMEGQKGIIFGYVEEGENELADRESGIINMLTGYNLEMGGIMVIARDDTVLTTNNDNYPELAVCKEILGKGTGIEVTYNDVKYIAGSAKSEDYELYTFFPASEVYRQRAVVLTYVFIFYCFYVMLFIFARQREVHKAESQRLKFLRQMSHDIRTPINGIRGMIRIANSCPEDLEKQKVCHQKIWEASDLLIDLVNDVLDMGKLNTGETYLESKPFNMKELVENTIAIAEGAAQQRGITITMEKLEGKHWQLIGSSTQLTRILNNILGNAIKYNKDNGSISLSCREIMNGQPEGKTTFEFVCADTGIGMDKHFQRHMFEQFTQENVVDEVEHHGTGLGLSIAKSLVDQMQGTIKCESERDKGTTFTIIIPFDIDPNAVEDDRKASDIETVPEDALKGVSVLLVEDNAMNMEIAEFILEEMGMKTTEAWNGEEATRTIRKLERPDAKTIPIIAATANAFAEDIEAAISAGMNDHLAKPLDVTPLKQMITKYVVSPQGA
jgi:signal transduction histidine kinase/CheY-like chemotaxis protein